VSDDLEQRLRDSLRAYADLVDAPEGDELPAPSTPRTIPPRGLRRWQTAVLSVAATAAVVTWSFWVVTSDESSDETAAGSAVGTAESGAALPGEPREGDSAAAAEDAAGSGSVLSVPGSPAVGVANRVDLHTHCGVLGIEIAGVWFAADPPLVEEGGHPPPGWDDPDQHGTLTLTSPDEAVFTDDAGHEVRLRSTGEPVRPPLCE
jgi:hypothetical protein